MSASIRVDFRLAFEDHFNPNKINQEKREFSEGSGSMLRISGAVSESHAAMEEETKQQDSIQKSAIAVAPYYSPPTEERIRDLGLSKFDNYTCPLELSKGLGILASHQLTHIRSPSFFSPNNETILKVVDALELFICYAVQSCALKSTSHYNKIEKSFKKAIAELEKIREHILANNDRSAIRIIIERVNWHTNRIYTDCLAVVERDAYAASITEACKFLLRI